MTRISYLNSLRRRRAAARALNPALCGWCGNPTKGLAAIDGVRYCHWDVKPSCYEKASHARARR